MKCPICGTESIPQSENNWCPKCRIFLGNSLPVEDSDKTDYGDLYRKRARKGFFLGLLAVFGIFLILFPMIFFFVLNFTSFGYREKVFYNYRFEGASSSYLRSETNITVVNIAETKPFGFTHSGLWQPHIKEVKLNTANDEVAIHELAHAWWEEKRKDKKTREGLINDMVRLSELKDENYTFATRMAQSILARFCNCPDKENINYFLVDDHHFYAYPAMYLMGRFKDGERKLPEFMWTYFETLFTGNPRIELCYETDSCFFNDIKT